jgi:hypothetical protein
VKPCLILCIQQSIAIFWTWLCGVCMFFATLLSVVATSWWRQLHVCNCSRWYAEDNRGGLKNAWHHYLIAAQAAEFNASTPLVPGSTCLQM